MEYEGISKITENIATREFKDKEGYLLETNLWYSDLKSIMDKQKERDKIYRETIALLNSMVLSGEKHGEKSQEIVERALRMAPTKEQIWEKATELLANEYVKVSANQSPSLQNDLHTQSGLLEALIWSYKKSYFSRAIVALESGK